MSSSDEHQFLTPATAAKRAGVSRPTITRALNNLELKGRRDNRNRWQIAADDLDAWAEKRGSVHSDQVMNTDRTLNMNTPNEQLEHLRSDLMDAREKLAAATAKADAAERARDQAESDRDAWRAQAEKLADQPRGWRWPWRP